VLFVYPSLEDVRSTNWICRSQWISDALAPDSAPHRFGGTDISDGIFIDWNDMYITIAKSQDKHTVTKEHYLEQLTSILARVKSLMQQEVKLTNRYIEGVITNQIYIERMREIETKLSELYFQSGNIGLPPVECGDLGEKFQSVMAFVNNAVLPFSEQGLKTWPERNRNFIVRDAIKSYSKELGHLEYELEKVQ
jgi:hypothetical protein